MATAVLSLTGAVLSLTGVLRVADHLYYRDSDRVLHLLRFTEHAGPRGYYYLGAVRSRASCARRVACAPTLDYLVYPVVVVVAATRFRVLLEVSHSHIALHRGLCRSKRFQWWLSDLAANCPSFLSDIHFRHIHHVREHQQPAVDRALRERDPHYARFASVGLFRPHGDGPSALSELFERLTPPGHPDVAERARNLSSRSSQDLVLAAHTANADAVDTTVTS